MSYYTELKQHAAALEMWQKDKVIDKTAVAPLRNLLLIHAPGYPVGSSNCGECVRRVMSKAAGDYYTLKAQYLKRRKGNKNSGE